MAEQILQPDGTPETREHAKSTIERFDALCESSDWNPDLGYGDLWDWALGLLTAGQFLLQKVEETDLPSSS